MAIDAFFVRLLCMLFMHIFFLGGGGGGGGGERKIERKGGE